MCFFNMQSNYNMLHTIPSILPVGVLLLKILRLSDSLGFELLLFDSLIDLIVVFFVDVWSPVEGSAEKLKENNLAEQQIQRFYKITG